MFKPILPLLLDQQPIHDLINEQMIVKVGDRIY
jgi:hypothetical protein